MRASYTSPAPAARRGPLAPARAFEPHGATTAGAPVAEEQRDGTARRQEGDEARAVEGGGPAGAPSIDRVCGPARLAQFWPARVGRHGSHLRFEVHHLSGYVLASARG